MAFSRIRIRVTKCASAAGKEVLSQKTASSDLDAIGIFYQDRAVPLLVICQPKSLFLRRLRDLHLAIFFSYRPEALQVLLVDSAVPKMVSLELQLTITRVGFTSCPV